MEEIIVTAQKRGENIQDVPAAVSAVSSQMLHDLHATQLTDIGAYVPALQIDSAGSPGQTTISMRGIAPIGRGATVATYIDDAPVGSSSTYGGGNAFALDLLPYDVQRLEVLRGPQGTLYGASSMGGLLKYVLTTPSLDTFEARVGGDVSAVSGASKPGGGFRGMLSGPIVGGVLGFTASYSQQDTPGFIDNSQTGRRDENGVKQQSARLGLVWQANDDLLVKLNALYQKVDADGDANTALDPNTLQPLGGSRTDNNLTDQPFNKEIQYYSLAVEYTMPWADLISSSSYTNTRTSQTQDASYTYGVAFPAFGIPAGTSAYDYRLHLRKYTQEIRLQSHPGVTLEWQAGLFATHEDSKNFQSPSALTMDGEPIPGLDPLFTGQLPSTYTEYAGFGTVTYHATDRLDLLAGVRYSENHQTFGEYGSGSIIDPISLLGQKSHEGVATYSVGGRYHITDKVMAYIRIASGYQPGGPNLAIAGVAPTFASDTLTNYEVGLKSQFLDNRVLFDIDAFYIDWNDIQLLSNGSGFNYILNGGSAKSQGIEANASVRPIDGLTLDATFSFVDSVLTEDVAAISGLSGDRLPNVPRWSGSLRATYSHDLADGWMGAVGAGLRLTGDRYSDVNHAYDARVIPGYGALDMNVSVSNDRYTLQIFAKNLTDRHAYLSYTPLVNQATGALTQIEATVLQPRTIGLSLDAKF
ncbi:TonB-dependent receptor [Nitrospirillum iridis]|uniref:Outer membrane receptor protein involved in Fe transport n=1 Tax=Nitrospirillum iridis TaxID=765888 RepID=A0A7X0AY28_9PROT|nr:TonB-dependent receptor [Nitrospirillum iridis]MBB6252140.1 outer membrane receptor protein involved in Fe transport [Nitrospirillum iridis]